MASRVWVLHFLVQRAQQGFFTMDGKPVFQVGPEKHQWPPGGKSPPAKIAMSLLSFGQKAENQPSQDLLRFVAANWRAVVGYAFHPPTSSRGMMRLTNPHDNPAPYATQPPYTLQLPLPRTFVARSSTQPCMFARLGRRPFEVALRTTGSPKPSAAGRGKAKAPPVAAAAKKRSAAVDADEDDAGVEDGGGGKKPKRDAESETDDDEE